jgi:WS/DGAT/MGAT family acyltransferase
VGYEPLSAGDRTFLVFEDDRTHMHLGGIALFEAGPLARAGGGLDIACIRSHIAARLHLMPRYRQRLAWVPIRNRPIWVDDEHFNLEYHVRHTAVPQPGDDAQLKALAARIVSQQLDRGKPLWEVWVIEGLERGRFALLVKTHHCMADGISAFDLFAALMGPSPDDVADAPPPWRPRPAPSTTRLVCDELVRTVGLPLETARGLLAQAVREPGRLWRSVVDSLTAIGATVGAGALPPSETPLNRPIGPHRRFDWVDLSLTDVKALRRRAGGTVNDIVLAVVAGAVRRFLTGRGVDVARLHFRAVVPVSVRTEDERGVVSNRVSGWLTQLPVAEPDPRRRLVLVQAMTARLKETKQALGPEVLGRVAELVMPGVLTLGVRLAARLSPFNLIVTNVPGPPVPLYFRGARLVAGYPLVPLFENQGLGVALFSYMDRLCWGFNADWDLVPDLDEFSAAIAASFDELCEAVGIATTREAVVA